MAEAYTGPVGNITQDYINVSGDSLNISVNTPNWFIHSSGGTNAIAVSSGTNVLDGGSGSSFLSGGSGTDTFFINSIQPTVDTWSTVANFHAGDAATFWGLTPEGFSLDWARWARSRWLHGPHAACHCCRPADRVINIGWL